VTRDTFVGACATTHPHCNTLHHGSIRMTHSLEHVRLLIQISHLKNLIRYHVFSCSYISVNFDTDLNISQL